MRRGERVEGGRLRRRRGAVVRGDRWGGRETGSEDGEQLV
ncbi:hypothetical protein LINGRAHAP2_LOCUS15674 [Linum grandiflorum]